MYHDYLSSSLSMHPEKMLYSGILFFKEGIRLISISSAHLAPKSLFIMNCYCYCFSASFTEQSAAQHSFYSHLQTDIIYLHLMLSVREQLTGG